MRVVAMFRVSTESQATEGSSLDAQERIYRAMAADRGWTTVTEFRGCESATQAASDRKVLQSVLACIREKKPDAIYVHEQSRLSRGDELDVAQLMRELREQNVKIIVNGTIRDLASIDERFMVGIQSLVDRAESERIKERMQRGKHERGTQGKKASGPAAYGYTNPAARTPGRGTLQIVPEKAAVVRKIFSLFAAGRGDRAVAVLLNEAGTPAPRGGKWGKSTVRRVLDCPAYLGTSASSVWVADKGTRTFRFNPGNPKAVLVENAHAAIIDRELWDAAHGRPRMPRTGAPRLLTGLLFVNGEPGSGDSERLQRYYRGPRGMKGCPRLDAGATDDAVWNSFASLATGPEFVERLMREAANPREQVLAQQEIEYLEDQLGKVQRRLGRFVEMRADGEITKELYGTKRWEAEEAIKKHTAELAALRAKAAVLDGTHAQRVVKAVQCVLGGRTKLTVAQKRGVLASIVTRIDVAAERTGGDFARDARGRVLAGRTPRWAVRSVRFCLTLTGANDAAHGAIPRNATPPNPDDREAARGGQLVTTYSDCAPPPETVRAGHKVLASLCSAPPAPAKP